MSSPSLTLTHGTKLDRKAVLTADPELAIALEAYRHWNSVSLAVQGRGSNDIRLLVDALNEYKQIAEPIFDSRSNSAQEVLQPSILEEFMEYLFLPVESEFGSTMVRRPERGFVSLVFHPSSMRSLLSAPEFTVGRKDHDFVIGGAVNITMNAMGSETATAETVVIPAVAIECKRYLERNMLDECSGTAARVKRATPYCLFVVVAEYLKMDDCSPELSKIDEIYILRRQRNSERLAEGFIPNPIFADLVEDFFRMVTSHLRRVWWDPSSAITRGKVFDFRTV